jgi:hypothetical protein
MYAMVRNYSGKQAPQLYSLLLDKKDEVAGVMRNVRGVQHYDVLKTADGCCTVTMCADKMAADESFTKAKDWLTKNATHLGSVQPTAVMEGPIGLHI